MKQIRTWNINGQPMTLDEIVALSGRERRLIQRRLDRGVRDYQELAESPARARKRAIAKAKAQMTAQTLARIAEKANDDLNRSRREASLPRNRSGSVKPALRHRLR